MCRLLGYVARRPLTPVQALGETWAAFLEISRSHSDGWGMAWYDEWDHLHSTKSLEVAHASTRILDLAEHVRTDALLAHLRGASPGFSVDLENTHPFTYGQLAFVHNGLIGPLHALEELIAPHLRSLIKSTADSERHFLALLSILENAPLREGVARYLARLHQHLQVISANCLLLLPDLLCAICDYDPNSFPEQREPGYFQMRYRITPHEVLVGSTGLKQDPEWNILENGHMLIVHRHTLQVEKVALFDAVCSTY
jgi:predicted glutamine amidotransferase